VTVHRWLRFGDVLHVAVEWRPLRGGEARFEPACARLDGPAEDVGGHEVGALRRCRRCREMAEG